MTTPRTRSLVSFAAALTVALVSAGCANTPSRLAAGGGARIDELLPAIRFDNGARDYVHVYLVGEKRQWLLGRVEVGARASLRIPQDALAEDAGLMRLAVLEGQRMTSQAVGDARAATTIRQPMAAILSQRWMFSQTAADEQITSLPRDSLVRWPE
jgi:hypothetical protein